jgi:hypothetical protein
MLRRPTSKDVAEVADFQPDEDDFKQDEDDFVEEKKKARKSPRSKSKPAPVKMTTEEFIAHTKTTTENATEAQKAKAVRQNFVKI